MFVDPRNPVRSFLQGCGFLAAGLTLALAYWTLTHDATAANCAPGGGQLFGVCRPTGRFLLTLVAWFALIFGALALPLISVLVLKHRRGRRDDG